MPLTPHQRPYTLLLVIISLLLAGCTALTNYQLNQKYGKATAQSRIVSHDSAQGKFFLNEVQPVFEKRCVVCHGCYDAPCQLKLSSPSGIDRGSSTEKIYQGYRLVNAEPTRLDVDAQTTEEWRRRGFFPVLNEREQDTVANQQASLIYRLLEQKAQHPLPKGKLLPDSFDLSLNRDQSCPSIEGYDSYARKKPLWGMPYGLPAIASDELEILQTWISQGALMAYPPAPVVAIQSRIQEWERLLNQPSSKEQLVARYIYEHWFLASLYFDDIDQNSFFELVRSSTPPGQAIQLIATRRPFDNPGVERVYYRFQPINANLLNKTHMPYALNPAKMARINELFFTPEYTVNELPAYSAEAANPFVTFAALPVQSRYKLMLDEAQFTIMGFIKGPVCRGNVALNVINDHFWIYFVDPDKPLALADEFITLQMDKLSLPAEQTSTTSMLRYWMSYSDQQTKYLMAKSATLEKTFSNNKMALNEELVWDGEKNNNNAALTIFRHYDSASVVKGLVGQTPQTAWIIDYTLLERIHYLLVAGFDVYGNISHQALTRLYMDFLRLEGEFNFLALLPQQERLRLRDYWYRDASEHVKSFLFGSYAYLNQPPGIQYKSDKPLQELHDILHARLQPALSDEFLLSNHDVPARHRQALQKLMQLSGAPATIMPESSLLLVNQANGKAALYSLMSNRAYKNLTSLLNAEKNRIPEEDNLTVTRGIATAYPSALMEISETQLDDFVARIQQLGSEQDYAALMDSYGIRRTNPNFWAFSDKLHQTFRRISPVSYGMLDYNRLENR